MSSGSGALLFGKFMMEFTISPRVIGGKILSTREFRDLTALFTSVSDFNILGGQVN